MAYLRLYGMNGVSSAMPLPIQSKFNPTLADKNAEIGQVWVNTETQEGFLFGGTNTDGEGVWNEISSGNIDFTSITVTDGPNSIDGDTLINDSDNSDTSINTGTSTGTVQIGNLGDGGAVTIASNDGIVITSSGVIALDSSNTIDIAENIPSDVNIGTATSAKIITLGNPDLLTAIRLTGVVTIGGIGLPTITSGTGVPGASRPKGSLYLRTDGSATNNRMYVATDAVGGWTPVTTGA